MRRVPRPLKRCRACRGRGEWRIGLDEHPPGCNTFERVGSGEKWAICRTCKGTGLVNPRGVRVGRAAQPFAPSMAWCLRCETPWAFVEHHDTGYTTHRGLFPLCEQCWAELTPERRLPYYRQLWDSWAVEECDRSWHRIKRAVLAGG